MNFPLSLKLFTLLSLIAILSVGCSNSNVANSGPYKQLDQIKPIPPKSKLKGTQKPYHINNKTYYPLPTAQGYRETGLASWYGSDFHGKKTSNGERYNMNARTAAHKTLPMGTVLLVKNRENGKKTTVRINDRGPFVEDRIIDLSYVTARELGILGKGTAKVEIIALGETTEEPGGEKEQSTPHFKKVPDFNFGKFYIQIGAYTNQQNAEHLARSFLRKGRNVAIQQFFTPQNTYYRVQVFAGTSLKNAHLFQQQLANSRFPGAFIIAR